MLAALNFGGCSYEIILATLILELLLAEFIAAIMAQRLERRSLAGGLSLTSA